MGMVQSRASLLEQAVAKALGGSRQLVLEPSGGVMPVAQTSVTTSSTVAVETAANQTPPTPAAPKENKTPQLPEPTSANQQPTNTAADSAPQPTPAQPSSGLDRQAQNLADFFNGQVLDVELNIEHE